MGNVAYGIVGSLALVVGMLAGGYITGDDINKLYYCATTGDVGMFAKISSTGSRGYWTDDTGNRYKDCKGSQWQPLHQYLESQDINLQPTAEAAPQATNEALTGKQSVKCNFKGCY